MLKKIFFKFLDIFVEGDAGVLWFFYFFATTRLSHYEKSGFQNFSKMLYITGPSGVVLFQIMKWISGVLLAIVILPRLNDSFFQGPEQPKESDRISPKESGE